MSDMQEFSEHNQQQSSSVENQPTVVSSSQDDQAEQQVAAQHLKDIEKSLDSQSYFLGEVPQSFLWDPKAFLPLNSDLLAGSVNMIEKLRAEANSLIQDEVVNVQKLQRKINFWEERIEKNKEQIALNEGKVKQNLVEIAYDKKNRDYWWSRAEQVLLDYDYAEASGRLNDWEWLIKKYGLKNPDGTPIHPKNPSVEELCNGSSTNLAGEYKMAGTKYEQAKKDKENQNVRLIHENGHLATVNETFQGLISAAYTSEVEPLQDGILLLKELNVKLKALSQDESIATYGALRSWAEMFLNEFLKTNPRVAQAVVTDFRRMASIPLPAENC